MNFNWDVFWQYLLQPSGVYLTGLWLTCLISVLAMLLGCVLGWRRRCCACRRTRCCTCRCAFMCG